jgi:anti-anti-sigma factor
VSEISSNTVSGVRVVSFTEPVNLTSACMESLQQPLYDAVLAEPNTRVVLDLSNVLYAGSQALGALVSLRLRASRDAIRLRLAGVGNALGALLQITQLDRVFDCDPTLDQALAHFSREGQPV